jgi:hypothetical protein
MLNERDGELNNFYRCQKKNIHMYEFIYMFIIFPKLFILCDMGVIGFHPI